MGLHVSKESFHWVATDEPHASRRREILAKYPQIRNLYGPDWRLCPAVVSLVVINCAVAAYASTLPSWAYWTLVYLVSGTITHSLNLAIHDLAHCLCFDRILPNELLSCVANFGQGVPSALTFKKYHFIHHYYQGTEGEDPDLPTEFEGRFFNTTGRKVLWCILQPLFYALRPLFVAPKVPRAIEIFNFFIVLAFDAVFARIFGLWALFFLVSGTILGMGLHPMAGHFIAEHYEYSRGQETYSYYGPFNWISFNAGYHVEHHDFPKISCFNLPKVKAIAQEYYDERWRSVDGHRLYIHSSWIKVIYDYITDPSLGPYCRIKRGKKIFKKA